jgi:TetR/AcrR family transcriptional regulator, copper-responsive repressor
MIGVAQRISQTCAPDSGRSSDHTVPCGTGRPYSQFPGISCQATIVKSLRDIIRHLSTQSTPHDGFHRARGRFLLRVYTVNPPSTGSETPVMKPEVGEDSQSTASATSSGVPKRRTGCVKKALPVFWRCGFADTSLHELEQATGANKSGLCSEFNGKEDLFVQSLRYYQDNLGLGQLLVSEPLGWDNIERLLKARSRNRQSLKGCFAVNSMRETAILPREAVDLLTQGRSRLKELIAKNIAAEKPGAKAHVLAELVLAFFTGLRMEHNVSSSQAGFEREVDEFMKLMRKL